MGQMGGRSVDRSAPGVFELAAGQPREVLAQGDADLLDHFGIDLGPAEPVAAGGDPAPPQPKAILPSGVVRK